MPERRFDTAAGRGESGSADAILRAAGDLLRQVGPRRTTLTEVARRSGMSRMSVYRRYQSVNELISAVLHRDITRRLAATLGRPMEGEGPLREQIVARATEFVRGMTEQSVLSDVLEVDPIAVLPLIVDRFGRSQTLVIDALAELIEQAQRTDGSVRAGDPRQIAVTSVLLSRGLIFSFAPAVEAIGAQAAYEGFGQALDGYLRPPPAAPGLDD